MISQKKIFLAVLMIIVAISLAGWIVLLRGYKTEPNGNTNALNINISNINTTTNNVNGQQLNVNNQPINTSDWQTYRNEELGFEVKYPKELKVVENNPNFNFKPDAEDQTNVSFESDQIINDCGCGIYIRVENHEGPSTVGDWLNSNEQKNDNYISQKQYDEKKNSPEEITRILAGQYSESGIEIDGISSLRQNYAMEGGGYDRILIPMNDKIYVITARSDSYYFNKKDSRKDGGVLADIFEEILQNFTLL